jgi:hypothetical protein
VTQLNQIIAVEKGVKKASKDAATRIYQDLQKTALLSGISRTYQPKDDEGETLPSESTLVQIKAPEKLKGVGEALTRLFDVTLTKEVANTEAKADVVVDGRTVLSQVPVTYLLFLERELTDIRTIVNSVPTLDPAFNWTWNEEQGVYLADPVGTVRTKKVPKNWVKAEATDKHPAQVEIFHEDVIVGYWTKVESSGAIPATVKAKLLGRITALMDAVTFAREQANGLEVEDKAAGAAVFDYLFGDLTA